ncbi:MAG TPA: asparagine synthase (glutamine-hydrolyzing) [Salinarimonas sp.]|nr:asparagine synthase (glutamine-hydrolyzing) [Salinarimonas sp.]
MCGIAGLFGDGVGTREDAGDMVRMLDAIAHRGPDGRGTLARTGAVLGHVRLSIVDLPGGAQPLEDETGDYAVTFNGEIFNHVELRRELEARGARFRTRSDTEVLLRLYIERGEACLAALNGDFAFAIHDRRRNLIFAARDRVGVRPFFWTRGARRLAFASEIKALLALPEVEARPDPLALAEILTLWFPLAPRTAYRDVFELPPGHVLVARPGAVEVRAWWRPDYPTLAEDAADRRTESDIRDELAAALREATRIRLRADVPVGAYLSGGFDSSLTTALASEFLDRPVETFSVTFEDAQYDESAYQREIAARFGTNHHPALCRGADIAAAFPDVVRAVERPILRTAPAPLYALARSVRAAGTKVVLTGEGADEVFAGYIFKEAKVRRFCARQPSSAWRPALFRRLYPYLPGLAAQSPAYLRAFFGMALDRVGDPLFSHLPRFATTSRCLAFLSGDLRAAIGAYDPLQALRERLPERFATWHPLAQAQYLEIAHLLPGYILSAQGDRVSMAHAVEGRFPFLDPHVIDLAARLPARLKLKGLREKHMLRDALGSRLPASVVERPKQPYRSPDAAAFFGDAPAPYVAEALSPAAVNAAGLFDPGAVGKLARKCAGGGARGAGDNMALVAVLSGQLWARDLAGATPLARSA